MNPRPRRATVRCARWQRRVWHVNVGNCCGSNRRRGGWCLRGSSEPGRDCWARWEVVFERAPGGPVSFVEGRARLTRECLGSTKASANAAGKAWRGPRPREPKSPRCGRSSNSMVLQMKFGAVRPRWSEDRAFFLVNERDGDRRSTAGAALSARLLEPRVGRLSRGEFLMRRASGRVVVGIGHIARRCGSALHETPAEGG